MYVSINTLLSLHRMATLHCCLLLMRAMLR